MTKYLKVIGKIQILCVNCTINHVNKRTEGCHVHVTVIKRPQIENQYQYRGINVRSDGCKIGIAYLSDSDQSTSYIRKNKGNEKFKDAR